MRGDTPFPAETRVLTITRKFRCAVHARACDRVYLEGEKRATIAVLMPAKLVESVAEASWQLKHEENFRNAHKKSLAGLLSFPDNYNHRDPAFCLFDQSPF